MSLDTTCQSKLLSDGYLTSNCLNIDTRTKDNIIQDIIKAEEGKNTLFVFYKTNDYTKITDATFATPEYIQYRSGVDYTIDKIPLSKQVFALKISTFITIPKGGLFTIELNKGYSASNIYIDNILIGKQIPGGSGSANLIINDVYISEGIHYLCIETTSDNNGNYASNAAASFSLTLSIYAKGTTKTSVNTLITTPYTLLTNITKAKNSADINYCKAGALFTNDYCKALLKSKSLLNDNAINYCYDDANSKYSYNQECMDLMKKSFNGDSSINTTLASRIRNYAKNWTYKGFDNADKNILTSDDLIKFKDFYIMANESATNKDEIIDNLNAYTTAAGKKPVPAYCEKIAGDIYQFENNKDGICNYIYNNDTSMKKQPILDSINTIKKMYCTKKIGNNFRYETDANCNQMVQSLDLLNTDINNRCIVNNKFNIDDSYCNSLVDTYDITKPAINKTLFDGLITSKTNYMKDEIANISKDKPTLKTLNYATNIYKTYPTAKVSDDILQPSLLTYCEVEDPMLSSNINTCKNIYTAFSTEPKIKDSRSRMRFNNCAKDEYLMTNNNTDVDIAKNINQCNTLISDMSNLANISRSAPLMNSKCSTGDNIVSDTCKNYYSNIEAKILEQFKPKTTSTFIGSKECADDTTVNPDGITTINPDGSKTIINSDGITTINSDGSKTTINPDGTTIINSDETTTINPDGTKTIIFKGNGYTVETIIKLDGNKIRTITNDDGTIDSTSLITINDDKTVTVDTVLQDGTKITKFSNPTNKSQIITTIEPDGAIIISSTIGNSDGSKTITTTNADGSKVIQKFDSNGQEIKDDVSINPELTKSIQELDDAIKDFQKEEKKQKSLNAVRYILFFLFICIIVLVIRSRTNKTKKIINLNTKLNEVSPILVSKMR